MKFKIGEIAIITGSCYPEMVGLECEIIGINVRTTDDIPNDYRISIPSANRVLPGNSTGWCINEGNLRKRIDKGDWKVIEDALGWNPTKEIVNA